MDLSIIIVNHNSGDYLKKCLDSLKVSPPRSIFEIFVVDNASEEGDLQDLENDCPEVTLIRNSRNLGFARAINQAIVKARGRYFLILNPDTLIFKNGVDHLVDFMEEHPEAGAAGPLLLYPDGTRQPSCRSFPTPLKVFFGRTSLLTKWFPKNPITRSYLMENRVDLKIMEVDWVMGACIILRRKAVEEVGGFDESFFLYVEDADLCYRLRKKGWRTYFVPQARAIHHYGASARGERRLVTIEHNKSMYRFFIKHYRPSLPIKSLLSLGLFTRLFILNLMGIEEVER